LARLYKFRKKKVFKIDKKEICVATKKIYKLEKQKNQNPTKQSKTQHFKNKVFFPASDFISFLLLLLLLLFCYSSSSLLIFQNFVLFG